MIEDQEVIATLRIDPVRRRLWLGEEPLLLSKKEVILLTLLDQRRGRPVPRELLSQAIYAGDAIPAEDRDGRIDSLVARLRGKLERPPFRQLKITTVRGIGYQLDLSPDSN